MKELFNLLESVIKDEMEQSPEFDEIFNAFSASCDWCKMNDLIQDYAYLFFRKGFILGTNTMKGIGKPVPEDIDYKTYKKWKSILERGADNGCIIRK